MAREVVFKDHQAKLAERAVTIRMDDGQAFVALPPELWPDETLQNAATDPIGAAEGILDGGHDAYLAFRDAGGNAAGLLAICEEEFGLSLPESSASSSS